MTDDMKLYWKLYYQWFPNNKILNGIENPFTYYLNTKPGNILDIGCGQSEYILSLLDTKHKLIALDTEPLQIEYLKKRISDEKYPIERVDYITKEFPCEELKGYKFSGIVLSNLLHFMSWEKMQGFIQSILDYTTTNSIIAVTVHSWKHLRQKDKKDYFKHFFKKSDLYKLFPKSKFEYLYLTEKEAVHGKYFTEFIKEWIRAVHYESDITDEFRIQQFQKQYLKKCRINNFNLVLKVK